MKLIFVIFMGIFDLFSKKEETYSVKDYRTLTGHTKAVLYCNFSPDSKKLASASLDNTIKLWDVETGNLLKTLTGHSDIVNSCCFSPDGKKIASASCDKTIRIWNVDSGDLVKTIEYSNIVNNCCFSPNGNTIASAMRDSKIIIWDAQTGSLLKTIYDGNSNFDRCSCCYSADGKNIVCVIGEKGFILSGSKAVIWNVNTEKISLTLEPDRRVGYCCYSPDNTRLGVIDESLHRLSVWNAISGKMSIIIMRQDELLAPFCNFSPNSKLIVSAYYDKAIIWSASNGMRLLQMPHSNRVSYCCFSSCGKFIASSSWDGKVKVWDTGGLVNIFKGDF